MVELAQALTAQAQRRWTLSTDPTATRVAVETQDLLLTSTRDEQISLELQVLVTLTTGARLPDAPVAQHKRYTHAGLSGSLRLWLDERSDGLPTSRDGACRQLAAQVVSDLASD